mgnify:CR=1 FL=1
MSTLERLGFASDATVAVVHADDIGMSHAANVGSFETLTTGSVTCGSVMVPCPWFAEAAAWAVDGTGRPQFAVVPGGEAQREVAFRFGVNLVMYVLTGNYKSDQVHVPALLDRLGQ